MLTNKSFTWFIQFNIKKITIAYKTFKKNREIRKAYGYSDTETSVPQLKKKIFILLTSLIILVTLFFILQKRKKIVLSLVDNFRNIEANAKHTKQTKPLHSPATQYNDFIYGLIADKSKKQLSLFKYFSNDSLSFVKTYDIAIGEKDGRKQKQGDKKTPEGFYWLIDVIDGEVLPPIYGVRAFVINYPNNKDKLENRTGKGIWIHGCEKNKKPDKTKGCLEMNNQDLNEISNFINVGTPLIIKKFNLNKTDTIKKYFEWKQIKKNQKKYYKKYQERTNFAKSFIKNWKKAWESKDISKYASYYIDGFSYSNMKHEEWKKYKQEIFENTDTISVSISNIKIMKMIDDTVIIQFNQKYKSGNYFSNNNKILKVNTYGNNWKIIKELVI